jgi:AAHS family 4-hydroxybenzoate transporter-like MFS transporter
MATNAERISVSEVIDAQPWSSFQIRTLLLIAATVLFDGIDTNILSPSVPVLAREWAVSPKAFASIFAIGTVAMLVGSAIAGVFNDRIGRRWSLIGATALYGIGSVLGALSPGLVWMGGSRIVAGLGLGGVLVTSIVSTAEHSPARNRAVAVSLTAFATPVGGILAGALAVLVLEPLGWRALFLIGGVAPLILAAACIWLLPETPVYLAGNDRGRAALGRYFERTRAPISVAATIAPPAAAGGRGNPLFLLSAGLRRNTLLLWVGFFSWLLATYMILSWLPTLLTQSGVSPKIASASISYISMGSLIGGIVSAPLVYRFGSRPLMIADAIWVLITAVTLSLVFDAQAKSTLIFFVLAALMVGFSMLINTFYALLPFVYPDELRGAGIGFSLAVGRLGVVASAFVGAWGMGGGGRRFFGIAAAAALVGLMSFGSVNRHAPPARAVSKGAG